MFSDLEPRKIGVLEPEPDEVPAIEAAEFALIVVVVYVVFLLGEP